MSPLEDVTLGELARSLDLLRASMTDEVRGLRAEIRSLHGSFVPVARYEPEIGSVRTDIIDLQLAAKADRERSERMRLAVFTSIAAPLIVAVILAVVMVKGG